MNRQRTTDRPAAVAGWLAGWPSLFQLSARWKKKTRYDDVVLDMVTASLFQTPKASTPATPLPALLLGPLLFCSIPIMAVSTVYGLYTLQTINTRPEIGLEAAAYCHLT